MYIIKIKEDKPGEGILFFTCPEDTSQGEVTWMFKDTGGDFKEDEPNPGCSYYYY